jgi:hypothetical protein
MKVEVKPDVPVVAKTVGDLRSVSTWPSGLVLNFPRPGDRHPKSVVEVERPANRHNEGVVERAVERLGQALQRDGVICEGDLSRHLLPLPKGAAWALLRKPYCRSPSGR